jgi:hypothetical protein
VAEKKYKMFSSLERIIKQIHKKFKFLSIVAYFLIWRIWLFAVAAFSAILIPNFGNRFPYWQEKLVTTGLPYWIWGFGNFDGVHYLTIAQSGYTAQYTQAFFPLFPLMISMISLFVASKHFFEIGLVLSNIFFLISLFVLYKLFRLDWDEKIAFLSILLLLVFPTSFYFGAIYSESLFLLLASSSLYFARKSKFFLAGLLAALCSATRVVGIFLFPVLVFEFYKFCKEKNILSLNLSFIKNLTGVLISPFGLLGYVVYLKLVFNNPFYFLSSQSVFGRTAGEIILPHQVLFRYIKMLMTVSPQNIAFYNAFLELVFTACAFCLVLYALKKVRTSYLIFTFACLFLPTLTGTLSSMPRYVLSGFLLLPIFTKLIGKLYPLALAIFLVLQFILLSLFIRGYWVA